MVHDAMLQIGGATYGFSSSGAMLIGWHLDASVWHYFSGSGALVKGWLSRMGVVGTGLILQTVLWPPG